MAAPTIKSMLKVPASIRVQLDAHKQWLQILDLAQKTVEDEAEFQQISAAGARLQGRALPPQVLGRYYARYCDLINRMYDAYLNSIHLQRSPYILEIITVFMKRLYELRNELVHVLVNDYIYVDAALEQLKMTPFDIQVLRNIVNQLIVWGMAVVFALAESISGPLARMVKRYQRGFPEKNSKIVLPYHYPLESRSEDREKLLQMMWAAAIKRKKRKDKLGPQKPLEPLEAMKSSEPERQLSKNLSQKSGQSMDQDHVHTEEEVERETPCIVSGFWHIGEKTPSVHTVVSEEIVYATLIQRHERFRQWFAKDYRDKCIRRKTYFASTVSEPSAELIHKAAKEIQRVFREYMKIKRKRVQDTKRDILLGILPVNCRKKLDFNEENNKIYEKRRQTRLKIRETYMKEAEKENSRLILFKKDNQISDITDQVTEWFKEWYYGYGFFPEYPYEIEGGTVLVITGQYKTIQEKQAEDAALALQTKNKEQLQAEKERAKSEAKIKAEQERIAKKKEALAAFKAKWNPFTDPGYQAQSSTVVQDLIDVIQRYRSSWSIYDNLPPKEYGEAIYGYMKPLLTEDLMCQLHKDCRKYVDELMRLDLKLLVEAHQMLYKSIGKKFPKVTPRKKPKTPSIPKPLNVDQKFLNQVEIVFDLGLISKPYAKLTDVFGDMSYAAYDYNIRDPDAKFPPPGYGDIKRRLMLSCILGCGIQPGATRNKGVMLLGPAGNGKSFLVDVVAGELNAVKIDITPEVFSAVTERPAKALLQVFQAAKAFQPAVIYMRNIERVFLKNVLPEDKYLQTAVLKPILGKMVKQINDNDKIIFIATCSDPFATNAAQMVSMFNEIILVPRTDYGSLSKFFFDKLQREISVPRDFPVGCLAQVCQGYGFGDIIKAYDQVMSPARIVRLCTTPLSPGEFLEVLLDIGTVLDDDEYQQYVNFYIENSPIKTDRAEFAIINQYRAAVYDKTAKLELEAQKKKEKNK